MSTQLPPEIISLVHHLELNRSGWWDLAIEKLIIATVWQSGRNLTEAEIQNTLRDTYSIRVGQAALSNRIHHLKSEKQLIAQTDGTLRLSEAARKRLDEQVTSADALTARLRSRAAALIPADVSEDLRQSTWAALYEGVLVPWIRATGAHAYQLLAGANGNARVAGLTGEVQTLLDRYPVAARDTIRATLESWLSSDDADLRQIVLRTLNAHFVVQASCLDKSTLDALVPRGSSRPQFNLLIRANIV